MIIGKISKCTCWGKFYTGMACTTHSLCCRSCLQTSSSSTLPYQYSIEGSISRPVGSARSSCSWSPATSASGSSGPSIIRTFLTFIVVGYVDN